MNIYLILLLVLIGWNIVVFFMYWFDKYRAKTNQYRISEKTLLWCAFLGGGIGAFFGMKIFRHKTRHKKFFILVPLYFIIALSLFGFLFYNFFR